MPVQASGDSSAMSPSAGTPGHAQIARVRETSCPDGSGPISAHRRVVRYWSWSSQHALQTSSSFWLTTSAARSRSTTFEIGSVWTPGRSPTRRHRSGARRRLGCGRRRGSGRRGQEASVHGHEAREFLEPGSKITAAHGGQPGDKSLSFIGFLELRPSGPRTPRHRTAGGRCAHHPRTAGGETSHYVGGTPVQGGRARRFYHCEGLRALNDARAAVDSSTASRGHKGSVCARARHLPAGLTRCCALFSRGYRQRVWRSKSIESAFIRPTNSDQRTSGT